MKQDNVVIMDQAIRKSATITLTKSVVMSSSSLFSISDSMSVSSLKLVCSLSGRAVAMTSEVWQLYRPE